MHGGEVVEDGLQLVLLHPVANHDELLEEQQHVRAEAHHVLLGGTRTIYTTPGKKKVLIEPENYN